MLSSKCTWSWPAAPSTTRAGSRPTCHRPRLIMVKADGCIAIHADGGAYKPLNWMNAPNTVNEAIDDQGEAVWTVRSPRARP